MAVESAAAPKLTVSGLGCMRGGKVLFRNLDFELVQGQALVLKGANGAGKSTLLRSLAGLLPWRAGQLQWSGQNVKSADPLYLQQVAYLGHLNGMSDAMTGLENLRFGLTLMGAAWDMERVQPVLHSLALQDVVHHAFGRLSQGQRRRLGLARVWLGARPLWLLDEPDNSLDDDGCERLGHLLAQHLSGGGMAVVVTHRGLHLPADRMQLLTLQAAATLSCARRSDEVLSC